MQKTKEGIEIHSFAENECAEKVGVTEVDIIKCK